MRRLPALVVGPRRWVLPMADGSADALAEWLLAGETSQPGESLSRALAGDPPLLLWTVCVAAQREGFEPRCVDDVAQWLGRSALDVLRWESGQQGPPDVDHSDAESFADRVTAALEMGDVAARLAAESGQSTADAAFLLGLLHDADGWLAMTADPPMEEGPSCLPRWLVNLHDAPAAASVRLAAKILAGEAPLPDSSGIDPATCRSRAAKGRQRWLARVDGLGRWLPPLAARLARLAALEDRFEETLETEKLEAMAEFAAGAGHEINNPLAVIAGRAQLFLRGETDPERRRALALINAQAKRVYEMIADMMLFARPPRPEPEAIDLVALVDRLVEELSPRAAQQETTLCRVGASGPMEIEADPTQLTVALRALCHNALEAIGRDGHVEIELRRADHHVEIQVSDDGPGVPSEERRHLFDPYYSARQAGRGLGLGLSKCWRIVTNHGGRIDVDSRPGHGAVFTIRLPKRPP